MWQPSSSAAAGRLGGETAAALLSLALLLLDAAVSPPRPRAAAVGVSPTLLDVTLDAGAPPAPLQAAAAEALAARGAGGGDQAGLHVVVSVCKEEAAQIGLAALDCAAVERCLLYLKCGPAPSFEAEGALPACCTTVPHDAGAAAASKAEETFVYDMLRYKRLGLRSGALVYLKASIFRFYRAGGPGAVEFFWRSLPQVAARTDFVALSYGRSVLVDTCGENPVAALAQKGYRFPCKGWTVLRDNFAVSSRRFDSLPPAALERLMKLLSEKASVKATTAFLERGWSLMLGCRQEKQHWRYCARGVEKGITLEPAKHTTWHPNQGIKFMGRGLDVVQAIMDRSGG